MHWLHLSNQKATRSKSKGTNSRKGLCFLPWTSSSKIDTAVPIQTDTGVSPDWPSLPPVQIILAVPEAPHKSPFLFLLVLSHSVSRGCEILELLFDAYEQGWSCLKGGKAVAMRRRIGVWFGY